MMNFNAYMAEYAESHRNPVNTRIHMICVPLIFWSLFGFFHSFTVMELPLSLPLSIIAVIFYALFRNIKVLMIALTLMTFCFLSFVFVPHLRWVSLVVFILSWIGQFYGHKVEGKKPSFFKDLAFLLIGPIWVIKKIFPGLL